MRRLIHSSLVAGCVAALCTAPATASPPPQLPALMTPASQEHHPGKIVYAELVTPDLTASEHFYGALFGWTFRDVAGGSHPFAEALRDGQQVAGLIERPLPPRGELHPAWLTFLSVSNVDAVSGVARQNGATLLFGPRDLPDLGRMAVFRDPQGAVFAALSSTSGDPPDVQVDDGDWIWSSLITSDPATSATFYHALFGYQLYDLAASGEARHLILASDNYARASVNPYPAERPNARPRWLDYVRVEDVAAMVGKVTSLGGRVLVAPHIDRDGSTVAVLADPLGAPFGLLEWSDAKSVGEAK